MKLKNKLTLIYIKLFLISLAQILIFIVASVLILNLLSYV